MAWPTPQEYNEAIQNPRTAFADPELQLGQPVLTKLGLPRPITGAFASVYQLVCPNQRIYAVRCFLREFGDSQERYAAISDHLAKANLPYTVNFTYLDQGIRVGRQWYPILKMEWIDGETLHGYVARHLNNPQALLDLAEQWVNMTQELRTLEIGHGDLQHGNVLVVGNRLRLIDYDGMYVPALNGRMSHEAGHRNYQHPQRTDADFGPDVDYFSTWVIYTSLVALSVEPQMWQTFKGGDECLIFRREDFERPTASSILRQFDTSPDPRLRSLAGIFRSVISLPADQTPPLDGKVDAPKPGTTRLAGWIRDSLAADATGQGSPSAANRSGPANGGTQTATTISKPSPAPQTAASSPATPYQASWIADFITPTPTAPVDFSNSFGRPRTAIVVAIMTLILAFVIGDAANLGMIWYLIVALTAPLAGLGYTASSYMSDPSVKRLNELRGERTSAQHELEKAESQLGKQEQRQEQVERDIQRQRDRLERDQEKVREAIQADLARYDKKLQQQLAGVQQRRDRVRIGEVEAAKRLDANLAQQLQATDQQIAALRQGETAELQRVLQQRQQQFIASYLQRQTIEAAQIQGIGPAIKSHLKEVGLVHATDITPVRLAQINGIGEGRTAALLDWRQRVESLARQAAPQSLNLVEETLIRGRFYQKRFKLEGDKSKLQRKHTKDVESNRLRFIERHKALDAEVTRLQARRKEQQDAAMQREREKLAKLQAEVADLDHERIQLQADIAHERGEIQSDAAQWQSRMRHLDRQLEAYTNLDFLNYVKRVVKVV